ncbi:MAG: hypothetical protein J6B16_02990 [Clostridia bacterium]|nr:hypothetical protein [Clostridia bacterium]
MTPTSKVLLLALTTSLTAGRNIISKKTALGVSKQSDFYFSQAVLFFSALVLLTLTGVWGFKITSYLTVVYGLIYGVLLILSQWMLTISLKTGNASICSVIYSLGFVFPTVIGAIVWDGGFTPLQGVGLALALGTILLSTFSNQNSDPAKGDKDKKDNKNLTFLPFILIAMLASGGLGLMQKIQQKSVVALERDEFLIIAFIVATVVSLIFFAFYRQKPTLGFKQTAYTAVTGLCFGGANVLNTLLAGVIKSAIFFPVLNVSAILLCLILSIIIFKERLTLQKIGVMVLSIATVLVFSV